MSEPTVLEPPPNSLVTSDRDLLVFVDETGHEAATNSAQLFGVGGIIVYGADYSREVELPWQRIRTQLRIAEGQPLHAATDRQKYKTALPQIGAFFEGGNFIRHVSIVTPRTISDFSQFITATCGGLFRNVGRALARVLTSSPVSRVVYVLEHSERLHAKYARLVGPDGLTLVRDDGTRHSFPHVWAALRKSSCTAGLEVADFVLHAAQAQMRSQAENPRSRERKDFVAVFRSVPAHLVEYMEINAANATPGEGATGTWRIGLL